MILQLNFPSVADIKKIYHNLGGYYNLAYGAGEGLSFGLDIGAFCRKYGVDVNQALNALKFLERDEYLAFNESVFLPSRYRFLVQNLELYNFRIQQPGWDGFIKTMLRSYAGAFDAYVPIREFDLATRMNLSVQKVIEGLNYLQSIDLLNYLPQTDMPQVTFVAPRLDIKDVQIDRQYIEQRKAIYRQKTEAVCHYATARNCRSTMLLSYFDEDNAPKCGTCDVCLDERRKRDQTNLADTLTDDIIQALQLKPYALDELIKHLKTGTEKQRIAALRQLLDAGKIKTDGHRYYL